MSCVIVTGMSGAGKSSVMKILEDDGFYCVDNLPAALIGTFLQLVNDASEPLEKVAVGLDIRGTSINKALEAITQAKQQGYEVEILYLEASTKVLTKRYKETRRLHPIIAKSQDSSRVGERVVDAIEEERELLTEFRRQAQVILDTSSLLVRDLKQEIDRLYAADSSSCNFYLTFVSFGYKYGIPTDADLVFDVRFLPNPYYVEEMRSLTGNDEAVANYVMQSEAAGIFLQKLNDLIDFLIPNYRIEGKTGLVIAIGCTGGKHRSVTLTNELFERYKKGEYGCKKDHRDIDKDRVRKQGDLQR